MEPKGLLPCSQYPGTGPYIMSKMNPVHTLQPYFPKIHFNIALQSMPRSSEWSLPFKLSNRGVLKQMDWETTDQLERIFGDWVLNNSLIDSWVI
jgi:hypothetical protein